MDKDVVLSRGSTKDLCRLEKFSCDSLLISPRSNSKPRIVEPLKVKVVNEKTSSSDIFSPVINSNREQRRAYNKHFRNSGELSKCPKCKNMARLYYAPPISEADDNIGMVYCEFCGKRVLKVRDTKTIGAYNIVKIV